MTVKQYREKCQARGDDKFYEFMETALEIWSNDACIGYMIVAAQDAGLNQEQIRSLVSEVKGALDALSLDEAAERYRHSSF